MRKRVGLIIAFFIVFGVLAILVPASEAIIRIMPLGDSITRGSGSTDQAGYRRELDLTLDANGDTFDFVGSRVDGFPVDFDRDHEGHSGWMTDEILNGRPSDPSAGNLAIWLPDSEPDIILLHIGTNDIGAIGYDRDHSAANVAAILDEIDSFENANEPIWVILARIINRHCSTDFPIPCLESVETTAFNDSVAAMVQDRIDLDGDKILIVDMEDGAGIDYRLTSQGGDMENNLHPNDFGYEKMSDLWFTGLMDILPQADAGPDQNVNEFDTVTLDASGYSDPKNGTLTYQWVQTAGTVVTLSDAQVVQPTFVIPDAGSSGETLTFRVTVTDEDELESADTVSIEVAFSDNCPLPLGHLDYCRDCGPCAEGEGDCDDGSECASGLTCVQIPGVDTCRSNVCTLPIGHLDYCRDCGLCAEGEGDCDSDSECQSGLTCVQVPGVDTCQTSPPICPYPVGHLDYCRDCGPCATGQGDCDNDGECQSGLTCVQVTGVDTCRSDVCTLPVGHLDYCRDCGPCATGQGDCDNDGECQSGLVCEQIPGVDACVVP